MMKKTSRVVLFIVILLSIFVTANALKTTATVKGGLTYYNGDIQKNVWPFFAVGGQYEVWYTNPYISMSMGIHPTVTYTMAGPSARDNFKTAVWGLDGLVRIKPEFIYLPIDKWFPKNIFHVKRIYGFGQVGYGMSWFNPSTRDNEDIIGTNGKNYSKMTTATQIPMIMGIMYYTDQPFNVEMSLGWEVMDTDLIDGRPSGKNDDTYYTAYTGLSWNFDTKKDTDGDGIIDKKDKDKLHPEDLDGFQDTDGIPDYDNDNDGIPDTKDKTPGSDETVAKNVNTKETYNGFQDNDGTPDVVPVPEKKPEPVVEQPKSEPVVEQPKPVVVVEPPKPVVEEPKPAPVVEEPKPVVKETPKVEFKKETPLVLDGITFKSGSNTIDPESYEVLDMVAASLVENKDVKIEIQGHTDSVGNPQLNKKLSQSRANAVKAYLVKKGVEAKNLVAKGYGSSKPVASNKTKDGQAKNRRIQFVKI